MRNSVLAVFFLQGFTLFGQLAGDTKLPCNIVEYLGDGPLVPVENDEGKKGYVRAYTGELIIPFEYDRVANFQNGSAIVEYGSLEYGHQRNYGLINKQGEVLVPIGQYEHLEIDRLMNGEVQVTQKCKLGLLDSLGKEIIAPKYASVGSFTEGLASVSIMKNVHRYYKRRNRNKRRMNLPCPDYSYSNIASRPYWPTKPDEKFSFVDKNGKLISAFKYDRSGYFSEGLAMVGIEPRMSRMEYGFIDKNGDEKIPLFYHDAKAFINGLAAVERYGKWGFINPDNEIVIPLEYEEVERVYNGGIKGHEFVPILLGVKKDGKWGIIDTLGKEVLPIIYDNARGCMSNSLFVAGNRRNYGVVDLDGNVIVPFEYDNIHCENELIIVDKNKKEGIYSPKGRLVQAVGLTWIFEFSEGLAAIERNNKWGYINSSGELQIPFTYDWCTSFEGGIALVKIDGEKFCIDKSGKILK